MQRWYERFPDRFRVERDAFEQLGFTLDEDEFTRKKRVVFRGELDRDAKDAVRLEVRYPDFFPYLRPEVFAPELTLERHQNPYRKNLCLLDRSTSHWFPSTTGAAFVAERVPLLLDLIESGDEERMREAETPQGEPASTYFGGAVPAVVFIPEEMLSLPRDATAGAARFSIGRTESGPGFRACLAQIETKRRSRKRQELARAGPELEKRFPQRAYEGRWVRLENLPVGGQGTAEELLAAARGVPGYERPPPQRLPDGKVRIQGIVCEEEARQGEYEDGWLFVAELENDAGDRAIRTVRGERLTRRDLGERIPSLRGLDEKNVGVTGLGALGGPISFELLRGQIGELRVLDGDYVESGTIVRWPLGVAAIGHGKAQLIEQWAEMDWPFSTVRHFPLRIGLIPGLDRDDPPPDGAEPPGEAELLGDFLEGLDLLVEATGEIGVQQLLGDFASELGIPQVYAWMTPGGFGGAVARVVPGETGCWFCLQKHLDDGMIEVPPEAEHGNVQPRACSATTWTGSSFDALPVVAQAVRAATFTALHGRKGDDVFICAQATQAGELRAPDWKSYRLDKHPECPCDSASTT